MQSEPTAWLQVRQFSKHFGGARALSEVDIDIHRGEVHGLVGANGAGKSTLIRSLAGVITPDTGTVTIDGVETRIARPSDAEGAGLAFIHQELNLVPHFSSIENILLGAPKQKRFGIIDWKASRRVAYEAAERIGVQFPLDRRVDELSVAERWLVMISKALARDAAMIAMDEPTASLSDVESNQLFGVIRDLAARSRMTPKSWLLSTSERDAVGSSIAIIAASRASALLIITSQRSATLSSSTRLSRGNCTPMRSAAA